MRHATYTLVNIGKKGGHHPHVSHSKLPTPLSQSISIRRNMKPWEQKRIFLFSHPRTASNLFIRLLSAQPDWETSDYLFFDSFQYTRDAFNGFAFRNLPEAVRREHKSLVDRGHCQLEKFIHSAMNHVSRFLYCHSVHANGVILAKTCHSQRPYSARYTSGIHLRGRNPGEESIDFFRQVDALMAACDTHSESCSYV